ncbi:uncharacterized protein LOC110694386 [Chenopodium quinoa]|uniref:uncharacterized protein LOC110694386 n=1 Tax=Chenopodium quinoa TaxID=63459 RepID=UPI000B76DA6A|nr:uncharacterized protein LOC110694386 [Chenopodium quinoa]
MSNESSNNSSYSSSNSSNIRIMMDGFIMSDLIEFFQMIHQVPRVPRTLVERDHEDGHNRLWSDYFSNQPIYLPNLSHRRFCMRKHVFLHKLQTLEERHQFFQQRPDAAGRLGASALQKCTAALRLLAYGGVADSVDDYLHISAYLVRNYLQHFVEGVVSYFCDEYLRRPNEENLVKLLRDGGHPSVPA